MYEYNAYLITGGTGFVGKQIVNYLLADNKKVYVLSRKKSTSTNTQLKYIVWNPRENYLEQRIEDDKVCVIHLAGANVADGRWTKKQKKIILESRVQASDCLFELIKNKSIKASYVVSASAIGYYGEKNKVLIETDKPANDFLGSTCVAWEQSVSKIRALGISVGILRLGIIIGKEGGATQAFLNSLKFGIAAIPSHGKQIYSWIHIQDVVQIFIHCSKHQLNEVYNAVAPNVCTAEILLKTLGKYYCNSKFISIYIPRFLLKIILGEFSIEILKSANVSSSKIEDTGFKFEFNRIDSACKDVLS